MSKLALADNPPATVSKPLYAQIEELLIQRIVKGDWGPGEILPSEGKLATEYGVHQGTVRKALEAMEARNLLIRQQGKGTFVTDTSARHKSFQFFRIRPRSEELGASPLVLPTTKTVSCARRQASQTERRKLQLERKDSDVVRLRRLRLYEGKPIISEQIALPAHRFPGLSELLDELKPDTIYSILEQKYRVLIVRVVERLSAVAASSQEARVLGIAQGAPLLQIERVAFSLDGQPVEWRVSRCLNDAHDYYVEFS